MRCPLCNGPVDEGRGQFGDLVDAGQVRSGIDLRLSEALWMAVQALDNEADMLRVLGGADGERLADEAGAQARRLRDFAARHARA